MQYTRLSLQGYTRIALSGHQSIELNFTEPLQVILGTNGAGKSSVLSEVSPWPANPQDFQKTGFKEIEINHEKKHYILKNVFFPQQKHSFLIDSIEHNPGGTLTVQKELIKEHFKLNQDSIGLLQGREKFTQMSPSRRKEIFISLCDTNYDYALKAFNKLKERHRDITGSLKTMKDKVGSESEKLLESKEEVRLREEVVSIHEILSILTEQRMPLEHTLEALDDSQKRLDIKLKQHAQRLEMLFVFAQEYHLSLTEVNSLIVKKENIILTETALLSKVHAEHEAVATKVSVILRSEAQSIAQLELLLKQLQARLIELNKALLVEAQSEPLLALNALASIEPFLIEIFNALPANEQNKYSSAALDASQTKLAVLKRQHTSLQEKHFQITERIKHLLCHKAQPNLECPSCKHKFSTHYSALEHLSLQAQEQELTKNIQENKEATTLVEGFTQSCSEYAKLYRAYLSTKAAWPLLKDYWSHIEKTGFIQTEPTRLLVFIEQFKQDLSLQLDSKKLSTQIEDKKTLLEQMKQVGTGDIKLLQAQQTEREVLIESHTSKLQKAQLSKTQLLQDKQRLQAIEQYEKDLSFLIKQKHTLFSQEQESLRRIYLNKLISNFHSALGIKETRLQSLALQQGIIANLQSQLFELAQDEIALQYLLKELSPTEGIIAEGLMQFMQRFTQQMNQIISEVWSYPLSVQTCDFTEGESLELDYKFPILVNGQRQAKSDVSKGSTGMLEIINFAFVMVAKHYLGLQTHPVYLDEFAKAMDATHKTQSVVLIKQLLDAGQTQQIFMISHDYEQYSANLNSAEVCVLCPDNVVTPEIYNKHVTLI